MEIALYDNCNYDFEVISKIFGIINATIICFYYCFIYYIFLDSLYLIYPLFYVCVIST